ncbi:plasmid mobilization relaxosome protein MobC [Dyadobacter flavalbus]|uniref:Plasmid mobilization relaxosome protein MobC n=1 Tax=Dyadobacter flavalbus TaxID=2579942 RepID=A0A5M8QX18_9BACT|nr:plasmid mobilization relaxosome protein MobC [Dyadobacter flavalbus]KAA6438953.1 plasmid mobilization relaxosome protein MobC [Dyadobacter flavalbus]
MEEPEKNPHYEARKAGTASRENKGKMIPVRVTEQEHAQIKANAILAGLSVSEYLRRLGTGHQVKARFEKEEKRNLQGIGTNLNQLAAYANKGFFNEKPLLAVLDQLKKVLQS